MVDKLKSKIGNMKKDKKVIQEYLECFCETEKINELFKQSSEFRKLKESIKKK